MARSSNVWNARWKIFEAVNTTGHYVARGSHKYTLHRRVSLLLFREKSCYTLWFSTNDGKEDSLWSTARRFVKSGIYPMPREMFANVHRRSLTLKDTVRGDCVIFVVGETSFKRISFPMEWKETIQLTNGIKSNNLYLNQSIILLSISNANSIRILFVNNEMYVFHFKHWFYFSTTLSTKKNYFYFSIKIKI